MKFGPLRLARAEGALLAHAMRLASRSLKKGHVLGLDDLAALAAEGHEEVVAARLEPGDVPEDEAAARLARAVCGPGLALDTAFTGRANLRAEAAGLAIPDAAVVDSVNAVDERVTVATLAPFQAVRRRAIAATVKIIPFAVPGAALEAACAVARARGPAIRVAPWRPRRVGLVQTVLPDLKPGLLDKTVAVTRDRLAPMGLDLDRRNRCAHAAGAVADALAACRAAGVDIALVLGASAIVDRRDVVPQGLVDAGGEVERLGMPIDPGNLTLLGSLGPMRVLGIPGSARSPRLHGFDWVLQRLVAGIPVSGADVAGMGAGGLLKEIASRPMPREGGEAPGRGTAQVAAVVLAAGQSRRMGDVNKLLAEVDGAPMIARTVDSVLASAAGPVVVVTGFEAAKLRAALAGRPLRFVHNPGFADGLSGSLQAALDELPEEVDGALVCLGDMPRVGPRHLDRLLAAFAAHDRPAICVPTHNGKRGNPVVWHRRFFDEMRRVAGDTGARHLIGEHAEAVVEVEMEDGAVLADVDTPEALAAARGRAATSSPP